VKRQINAAIAIGLLVVISLPIYGNSTQDRLGPVYPIIEPDWLEWLPKQAEKRLGEMSLSFSKMQLREAIQRHMPEIELPEVKTPRIYLIDPAVQTNQPLTDYQGKIVVPSGSRINPLEHLPGLRPIVILDGRKKGQVEWVKGLIGSLKPLVLIAGGDVLKLNEQLGMTVYPVPKALIERFSIQRVPVILSRDGEQVKIQEVVP